MDSEFPDRTGDCHPFHSFYLNTKWYAEENIPHYDTTEILHVKLTFSVTFAKVTYPLTELTYF